MINTASNWSKSEGLSELMSSWLPYPAEIWAAVEEWRLGGVQVWDVFGGLSIRPGSVSLISSHWQQDLPSTCRFSLVQPRRQCWPNLVHESNHNTWAGDHQICVPQRVCIRPQGSRGCPGGPLRPCSGSQESLPRKSLSLCDVYSSSSFSFRHTRTQVLSRIPFDLQLGGPSLRTAGQT